MKTQSWLVRAYGNVYNGAARPTWLDREFFVPMADTVQDAIEEVEQGLGLKENVYSIGDDGELHIVRWNGLMFQGAKLT